MQICLIVSGAHELSRAQLVWAGVCERETWETDAGFVESTQTGGGGMRMVVMNYGGGGKKAGTVNGTRECVTDPLRHLHCGEQSGFAEGKVTVVPWVSN